MAEQFAVSFDHIEMHQAFGPPAPVYLFMYAARFTPSQPDAPVWGDDDRRYGAGR